MRPHEPGMQTVVVIGSNSFSGQDFVDLLLEEGRFRVIGVSRSAEKSDLFLSYKRRSNLDRFEFHRMDLNEDHVALFRLLEAHEPPYVVNFASQSEVAPSWIHPEQWFETNAVAVARVGNFLRDRAWLRRYVHISTPEVYGSVSGLVREDAPMNPSTPYAASRAAAEMMLNTLVRSFDFPAVFVRSSNVYGAHQQLWKIIPRTAIYIRQGKILELHDGGRQIRSFIHIRDVSRGELAAMENGRDGEAYNLSPGRGRELREVVAMVCEELGAELGAVTRDAGARTGHDAVYELDSSKARAELGWEPRVGLAGGIGAVVEGIDESWAQIQREPLEYVHKP